MKNKAKILLCMVFLVSLLIQGCSKKAEPITPQSNPSTTKTEPSVAKYYTPYTGEEVKKEVLDNVAVLAIVENAVGARPQSGLTSADIVYETMAEGGISRLMALFQKNAAQKIGPIRSARPYFLEIAKEYNLPFAHCGGSQEALNTIKTEKLKSMNEMMNTQAYLRDGARKAPHNLYTSTQKLGALVKNKNYTYTPSHKLLFDKSYWDNDVLPSATSVFLKINRTYNTSYTYKNGVYLKSMDGKPTNNKEDNALLSFKNIVVQRTSMKKQKDGVHLDIQLVGSGDGYVISNGKYVKLHWSKKDSTAGTILTDEKGKTLPLNPGKTFWNIVDKETAINIK